LLRYNGFPKVSPQGGIVYHFPELQTSAAERGKQPVSAYLRERPWRFSEATGGQIFLAAGLGALNIIGALALRSLMTPKVVAQIEFIAFINSIYWLLLGYGAAFLIVPLIRYFWIQNRNQKLERRNRERQERAVLLNQPNTALTEKLAYAQQFAASSVVSAGDLAYTTETDLIQQEIEQKDKLDAEWERRLNQG